MKKQNIKLLRRPLPLHMLAILMWLLLAGTVQAAPLLNGVATHTELGSDQFIAGLYTTTLTSNNQAALTNQEEKRMQVRVVTDQLSARRFKRMWIEGMAINSSPAELEKHAQNMAAFSNMLTVKMITGDILSIERGLEEVTVKINDAVLGQIDDPQFFDLLLRTWIGPVPLSSEFRDELMAAGNIKPGPLARFEGTRPTETRIALVRQALSNKQSADSNATVAQAETTSAAKATAESKVTPPAIKAPSVAETAAATGTVVAAGEAATSGEALPEGADKVALAAPKIGDDETTAKPSPKPSPKAVALAPKQQELDLSIFDNEDDEVFTAESLLKEQLYYSQLAKYTHRFLKYPPRAWDRGQEGQVRLRVTIDRKGEVKDSEILDEARHSVLNKEALNAVKRASPYPVMPDEIRGEEYSFTFKITFKIAN